MGTCVARAVQRPTKRASDLMGASERLKHKPDVSAAKRDVAVARSPGPESAGTGIRGVGGVGAGRERVLAQPGRVGVAVEVGAGGRQHA